MDAAECAEYEGVVEEEIEENVFGFTI